MSGQRRNPEQPLTLQNKEGNRQSGAQGVTPIPVPSSNKPKAGRNDLPQKTSAKTASPSPAQTGSKPKAGRNDSPQKTSAKTASPSPAQTGRPLPTPPLERKRKILEIVNETFASNNDSVQYAHA